ncbi:MAG: hypothetical protein ACT4PU_03960 [Planctomycetota bacterium]
MTSSRRVQLVRRMLAACAACALALLLLPGQLLSQQTTPLAPGPGQPARGPITIFPAGAQYGFRDPVHPEQFVWVFLDGVEVHMEGRRLRGQTLVLVLAAPKSTEDDAGGAPASSADSSATPGVAVAGERVLEIFLDGDVSVDEGEERVSGASYYLLDNRTGVATVLDGELRSQVQEGLPLVARYELLRKLQSGTTLMKELSYTSCSFAHPHWHIRTPWARLEARPEGRVLTTGLNTVRVGDVPILVWPGYDVNVDRDDLLLRRIHIGSSSRFGTELTTEWEGDAGGLMSGLAGLFGAEPANWNAEWGLELSRFSRRGFFIEPSLRYRNQHTRGRLLGAFINDQAGTDHLDVPVPEKTRGRLDLEQRTLIGDSGVLDIEISRQSDRNFLNEYYEDEFKLDKPQETAISYREVVDQRAWSLLTSTRLNDFDTQVEYQPRWEARAAGEPVPGSGFMNARAFVDNARLLPDDATGLPSARSFRGGAGGDGFWPFDLPNGDRLQLKTVTDVTVFEQTVADGSETRFAGGLGAEWSRLWSGTREAFSERWNIEGLRRIVEARVAWLNRFAVTHDPVELLAIDATEQLNEVEFLELGLRDRVQTHQEGRVVTLFDADLVLPYFPHASRDNAGERWGPLRLDALWRPAARVPGLRQADLRWRAEFDVEDTHWSESYASYSTVLGEGRRLTLANSKVRRQFDFRTVGLEWLLNPKWTVGVFHQTDALNQATARSGILLRQWAHCWIIDLEVSERRGVSALGKTEDEFEARLRFKPIDSDPGAALLDTIGGRYGR